MIKENNPLWINLLKTKQIRILIESTASKVNCNRVLDPSLKLKDSHKPKENKRVGKRRRERKRS